MARIMYDSIRAAGMPPGGDLYCCYTDGLWANEAAVRSAFPGKPIVRISALGRTDADVIDVEPGCVWPPSAAAAWLAARPGATVYCGLANLASVVAALGTRHPYWVAHYTNVPHVCSQSRCRYDTAGAHIVGTQYGGDSNDGGYHFDVSAIYDDSWHGDGGIHTATGGGTPIGNGTDISGGITKKEEEDMPYGDTIKIVQEDAGARNGALYRLGPNGWAWVDAETEANLLATGQIKAGQPKPVTAKEADLQFNLDGLWRDIDGAKGNI